MELTIDLQILKSEVNLLQGIAERKGVGALSYLLIDATKKGITITGTDLDTTIQSEISAEVKTEGKICVSAKKICDIVRSLESGTVKIKKDDNDWVRITCNTSKWRMAGLPSEQFPLIPEVDSDEIIMDGDSIKTLIKHTCFAVTQEESRFNLSGAKLEVEEGTVTMVATDGSRISMMSDNIDDVHAEMDVLIPKKALTEVAKFVGNEVTIQDSPNHIKFTSGNRILISRKMAMNFPNYKMAIPKGNDVQVSFSATEMIKALKRVSIMADERNKSVKLEVKSDKMVITTTADGESEETVNCVVTNFEEDITIFLNWQYLTEFLAICDNPCFNIKDGKNALEVVDAESRYIVMPLRSA